MTLYSISKFEIPTVSSGYWITFWQENLSCKMKRAASKTTVFTISLNPFPSTGNIKISRLKNIFSLLGKIKSTNGKRLQAEWYFFISCTNWVPIEVKDFSCKQMESAAAINSPPSASVLIKPRPQIILKPPPPRSSSRDSPSLYLTDVAAVNDDCNYCTPNQR